MINVSNINMLSASNYTDALYGLRAIYVCQNTSAEGVIAGIVDDIDGPYIAVYLPELNLTILGSNMWINCPIPLTDGLYLITEENEQAFNYKNKCNIYH